MAVEEYIAVNLETNSSLGGIVREWSGGVAGTGIEDKSVKEGTVFIVKAESVGEAIKIAKGLYPGSINGKLLCILKSSMTEE